ncbi:MAG: DUF1761 family protein [Acidobacteriaceae bacterium]
MSIAHTILAFVISFVVSQIADWIFAGVLFHHKYQETPEIWRASVKGRGERRGIAIAALFAAISVAALMWLMAHLEVATYGGALRLAVAIWLIAALSVTANNAVFIRIHPMNAVSHAAGWLVKLAAASLIIEYFLGLG